VVTGNGYTNHCPRCLWSRDVDNCPGDRQSSCGGMMRPMEIESSGNNDFIVIHKCEKCGKTRRQRTAENDSLDAILEIMSGGAAKFAGGRIKNTKSENNKTPRAET